MGSKLGPAFLCHLFRAEHQSEPIMVTKLTLWEDGTQKKVLLASKKVTVMAQAYLCSNA